ncbi:MAG: hypothetical protein EOO41_00940, partial [Methanobacteriota archaeon]
MHACMAASVRVLKRGGPGVPPPLQAAAASLVPRLPPVHMVAHEHERRDGASGTAVHLCLPSDFRLIRRVYTSPDGAVHAAIRLSDGALVAIKQRFTAELGRHGDVRHEFMLLTHANALTDKIVRAVGWYESPPGLFHTVLEWAHGGDCAAVLKRRGTLTSRDAPAAARQAVMGIPEHVIWKWALSLFRALATLHDAAIIHRDVKCSNLLLFPDSPPTLDAGAAASPSRVFDDSIVASALPTTDEEVAGFDVKLADLGIARQLATPVDAARSFFGTPLYLSPEMLREHGYGRGAKMFFGAETDGYTKAVDVWAAGVALYELAAGVPPFMGASLTALAAAIQRGTYAALPSRYSAAFNLLIRQCLTLSPSQRCTAVDAVHMCLPHCARSSANHDLTSALATPLGPSISHGALPEEDDVQVLTQLLACQRLPAAADVELRGKSSLDGDEASVGSDARSSSLVSSQVPAAGVRRVRVAPTPGRWAGGSCRSVQEADDWFFQASQPRTSNRAPSFTASERETALASCPTPGTSSRRSSMMVSEASGGGSDDTSAGSPSGDTPGVWSVVDSVDAAVAAPVPSTSQAWLLVDPAPHVQTPGCTSAVQPAQQDWLIADVSPMATAPAAVQPRRAARSTSGVVHASAAAGSAASWSRASTAGTASVGSGAHTARPQTAATAGSAGHDAGDSSRVSTPLTRPATAAFTRQAAPASVVPPPRTSLVAAYRGRVAAATASEQPFMLSPARKEGLAQARRRAVSPAHRSVSPVERRRMLTHYMMGGLLHDASKQQADEAGLTVHPPVYTAWAQSDVGRRRNPPITQPTSVAGLLHTSASTRATAVVAGSWAPAPGAVQQPSSAYAVVPSACAIPASPPIAAEAAEGSAAAPPSDVDSHRREVALRRLRNKVTSLASL